MDFQHAGVSRNSINPLMMISRQKLACIAAVTLGIALSCSEKISAHVNIANQEEFEKYQSDRENTESVSRESQELRNISDSEPLQSSSGSHTSPIISKTYSSKIYVSKQISNFVTPDKVHDFVNDKLAKSGVNKRLQGVGLYFDQTIVTNCPKQVWSQKENRQVTIYLPEEICTNTEGFPIVGAIIADVYTGGGGGNKWYASYSSDLQGTSRAFTILHELGHTFGFTLHYDDLFYVIQDTPPFSYKSPYLYDLMGLETSEIFGFHSANVINRSTGIQESESALINDYLSKFPIKTSLGSTFSGEIWVYPNQVDGQHKAGIISEKFYYGPISIQGSLDYSSINKPMLAYVKAIDTQGKSSDGWIDRSVMQTNLWQNKQYSITLKPTGFVTPIPRPPMATNGEIVIAANLPGDGDKRNVYLLEPSIGKLQPVTRFLDHDAENPTISGNGTTIAYIKNSTKPILRIINRQGVLHKEIDVSGTFTSSFILDNSGTKVFYNGIEAGVNKLFIATITGSIVQRIAVPDPSSQVVLHGFGSNGTKFSFSNNGNVYIANADGTNIHHLSHLKEFIVQGALSPNGNEFVFPKYNASTNSQDLFILDLTTNQTRNLLSKSNANELKPSFSPNGKKIFFSSEATGAAIKLYSINLDGSGLQPYTLNSEKIIIGFSTWGNIPQADGMIGDVNGDGVISLADYAKLKANFGSYSIKILNNIISALTR
jgi:hypothetical protein